MSASRAKAPPVLKELKVSDIDPNPGNPRLIFPQDELDQLAESIEHEGVLVPIVVYKRKNRYVLVDGERRFRCARELGLPTIPAVITTETNEHDLLVQMFNIHLIREPWQNIPSAVALERLVEELKKKDKKADVSHRRLRDLTGMSVDRIERLLFALELPKKWRDHIEDGTIPLNWFWEVNKNVILPLERQRPNLFKSRSKNHVLSAFVKKRLDGVTATDTVSLRKVRPIIKFAAGDAEQSGNDKSPLDKVLLKLVDDPDFTIEEAYEDTVEIMVEVDKLERRSLATVANFERLIQRAPTAKDKDYIRRIGQTLIKQLRIVISAK